jgi:hypothetical protein
MGDEGRSKPTGMNTKIALFKATIFFFHQNDEMAFVRRLFSKATISIFFKGRKSNRERRPFSGPLYNFLQKTECNCKKTLLKATKLIFFTGRKSNCERRRAVLYFSSKEGMEF